MPHVVLTRLLGEAAYRHVLDHARTQRADAAIGKMRGHWGFLSRAEGCWTFNARDQMPRPSRPTAHHLANSAHAVMLPPPARAGSFSGTSLMILLSRRMSAVGVGLRMSNHLGECPESAHSRQSRPGAAAPVSGVHRTMPMPL